ncbi:nucleotide exchange factor GrpE [Streptantibioticus rubrisoli]|uniref:nucleotide exchange factor GrpE n=1 Tax=Streptantibioticus rubrisoli TaxID=1387313 RepID=UPI0027E21F61|nr:nucleotide exchange factor GrpE [Streptantibioticus rubrisoli]
MTHPTGSPPGARLPVPVSAPYDPRAHCVDPVLRLRPPSGTVKETGPGQLSAQLAERTADLQRLKAEYDNYRKRVRRDRLAVREIAVANVVRELLPVLDTVVRVRRHGDMTDGFVAVSDALETHLAALGLRSFGEPGEPFDPTVHEALSQARSPDVDGPTCAQVLRPGYRLGDQLLSPALVIVAAPPEPGGAS